MAIKDNAIVQAWLVIGLAVAFGASLAGVETALSARVARNKLNDTLSQIPKLVPGAESGDQDKAMPDMVVYRAVTSGGQQKGWVVYGKGQGFADVIELLIGMNMDATQVTGLYILNQKETPGLGNKIVGPWRDQFDGKPATGTLVVVKTGAKKPEDIQAITGATISSDSVTEIVNKTIERFRAQLTTKGNG